uniref:RNA-binding S4 domain-containing protein n=1 Tax=Aureoumbra lagunensis TaxID=44058 RepID=A0A7S3NPA8_9STRA
MLQTHQKKKLEKSDDVPDKQLVAEGVRLNKCLAKLSRRQADAAILQGKVKVSGKVRKDPGYRCQDSDIVTLNGKIQEWQSIEKAKHRPIGQGFIYLKYWKPKKVICTTDRSIKSNILDHGKFGQNLHGVRVFPLGRLDRDSTGLILLTSDGRLGNSLLRPSSNKEKTYNVTLRQRYTMADLDAMANGIVISSTWYRDKRRDGSRSQIDLTTKTKPCKIIQGENRYSFQITITEGRNRQIRRMCQARNLDVKSLHRIAFAGITLNGLNGPGEWRQLDKDEIAILRDTIENKSDDDSGKKTTFHKMTQSPSSTFSFSKSKTRRRIIKTGNK